MGGGSIGWSQARPGEKATTETGEAEDAHVPSVPGAMGGPAVLVVVMTYLHRYGNLWNQSVKKMDPHGTKTETLGGLPSVARPEWSNG